MDSLEVATDTGLDSDWCIIQDRAEAIPKVLLTEANKEDLKLLDLGCSQGCEDPGVILYRAKTDGDPLYQCFYCKYESKEPGDVHWHMDKNCSEAAKAKWTRTDYQIKMGLPPLKSDACGHVLCRNCANVSLLTKPPTSICMVCGLYSEAVIARPGYMENATPTYHIDGKWGNELTEVYTSGNLLAHHLRRYQLIRRKPFQTATASHWAGGTCLMKPRAGPAAFAREQKLEKCALSHFERARDAEAKLAVAEAKLKARDSQAQAQTVRLDQLAALLQRLQDQHAPEVLPPATPPANPDDYDFEEDEIATSEDPDVPRTRRIAPTPLIRNRTTISSPGKPT